MRTCGSWNCSKCSTFNPTLIHRVVAEADQTNEVRMKNLRKGLRYYSCLRLQNSLYNEVLANSFNRGYLLVLVIGFTVTAYCTVQLSDTLDIVSYSIFPGIAGFAMMILVIITGITGRIHDKSWAMISSEYYKFLNFSAQPLTVLETKVRRIIALQLLSNPSLKVWIGNLYFMKISTKLTLLALLINSTVYFLLTT